MAGAVGRVLPADWFHVSLLFVGIVGNTKGLLLLLAAAGLSAVAARPGIIPKTIAGLGTASIAVVLAMLVVQYFWLKLEIGALLIIASAAIVLVGIPVCAVVARSSYPGGWLDVALWGYLAAELVLCTVLFRVSTGSWSNYAIQTVVFGSILTARALSRVAFAASSPRVLWPVSLAALIVLISAFGALIDTARRNRLDRAAVARILEHANWPASAVFFVDRPGLNRVYGPRDLVYDSWLYPVFERFHSAEPRAQWLGRVLASGSIQVVVNPTNSPRIDGLATTLHALGFRPDVEIASLYYVWKR
jgi:hypothetical protein